MSRQQKQLKEVVFLAAKAVKLPQLMVIPILHLVG
jgi:hypothetical protein